MVSRRISLLMYSVTFRRLWAINSAILLVGSLILDFYIRQTFAEAGLGPARWEVWLSVIYGFGVGIAVVVWECRRMPKQAEFWTRFHGADLRDRLTWKFQRQNFRHSAWILVLMAPIFVWGLARFAFVAPAIGAMGIPMGLWVGKPVREFEQRLRNQFEMRTRLTGGYF
jgi:hypothetical protein